MLAIVDTTNIISAILNIASSKKTYDDSTKNCQKLTITTAFRYEIDTNLASN